MEQSVDHGVSGLEAGSGGNGEGSRTVMGAFGTEAVMLDEIQKTPIVFVRKSSRNIREPDRLQEMLNFKLYWFYFEQRFNWANFWNVPNNAKDEFLFYIFYSIKHGTCYLRENIYFYLFMFKLVVKMI